MDLHSQLPLTASLELSHPLVPYVLISAPGGRLVLCDLGQFFS